ncbi:MAG TPA: hypothetical protein VKC89_03740 [Patescibacteria group bacterium]|nr:hypothetical protein [Patescibacteria group bacterium]
MRAPELEYTSNPQDLKARKEATGPIRAHYVLMGHRAVADFATTEGISYEDFIGKSGHPRIQTARKKAQQEFIVYAEAIDYTDAEISHVFKRTERWTRHLRPTRPRPTKKIVGNERLANLLVSVGNRRRKTSFLKQSA